MLDKSELDEEFLREIASVGGSYGQKIEVLMSEMRRTAKAVNYLEKRIKRCKKVPSFSIKLSVNLRRRFYLLREEALKQRKNLVIYREALGLIKHREVFEIYDVESIKL